MTKLIIIIFNPKYLILIPKAPNKSHFQPTNHNYFITPAVPINFAGRRLKQKPDSKLKYTEEKAVVRQPFSCIKYGKYKIEIGIKILR